ncbi:hypothetical protein RP20_CCG011064 [Aedes albopictus]|nr:hypothetical protein RP20_CCG011064 [Aedes albopictus]
MEAQVLIPLISFQHIGCKFVEHHWAIIASLTYWEAHLLLLSSSQQCAAPESMYKTEYPCRELIIRESRSITQSDFALNSTLKPYTRFEYFSFDMTPKLWNFPSITGACSAPEPNYSSQPST